MFLETDNLILKKAEFADWKAMYRNIWSRPESAKYRAWRVTADEEDAKVRIQKTIKYQENHDTWLVYEKKFGQAIGFAGVEETAPHIYQDVGIALGPEYVGKGYGKHISLEATDMGRPLYERYGFVGMKDEMELPEDRL